MPPAESDATAAPAASNSSDFVRKLYKMLEDPTYNSVVRWNAEGDSFVVLENEKFTKTILPKHFKHSNFASFVRQLNKHGSSGILNSGPTGRTIWITFGGRHRPKGKPHRPMMHSQHRSRSSS
jgi:osomolarity two-component system response regulator SKN7